ncbi:MAG: hypothetical protein ACE5R6_13075 [Candidatus Heimdallarchaeota archaeon]
MSVIITFVVVSNVLKVPHPAYSLFSEQSIINPFNLGAHQNEMSSKQVDKQIEVYKLTQYSEKQPLQLTNPYIIDVLNPSFYEGDIRIEDLTVEMFENGDAEESNLTRWVNNLDGTPELSEIQRLNSTNVYNYVPSPQGDDYFFFFNATSFSTYWVVDYYANLSIPSNTLSISFQYSNRLESNLLQQSNMDLHIRFDFLTFEVIFFLYAKTPKKFNYNSTIGNKRYVHFLLNTTWGSNWVDVGPINVTDILLSLDLYNKTNLPPLFNLNRVLIECLATPPYQFHLLVDNISLKSQVLSNQLELLVNGTSFHEIGRNTYNVRVEGFTKGDLRFQLAVSNGSLVIPSKMIGFIVFNLLFQEDLLIKYDFTYINQTSINWNVFFNITYNLQHFLPKMIKIRVPATWSLYSLQNPHYKEVLQECNIEYIENSKLIEFYGGLVFGNWHFAAYAPNYIRSIQISPIEVEQNSIIQLTVLLRFFLESPVTIFLLRDGDNTIYYNTSEIASSDGSLFLNIPIGYNFPQGNYTVTAQISTGFYAGIQYASIIVPTRPALLITDNPQLIPQYEPLPISLQMIDLSTHFNIPAEFFYLWDNSNELVVLNQSGSNLLEVNSNSFLIDITELSLGKHFLKLEGRSPGYPIVQKTINITIIPSVLFIDLEFPEKIFLNDIVVFRVRVSNNFSHPIPEMNINIRIDGKDVAKSKTDLQGYSFITWEVPTDVSNDVFVEVIVTSHEKILGTTSQYIQIEKIESHDMGLLGLIQGSLPTISISIFTFVLSSMVVLYRHRRSDYNILFGKEIPKKQQEVE